MKGESCARGRGSGELGLASPEYPGQSNGVEATVGSQDILSVFCMHQAGSSLQHPDLCSISLPLVRDPQVSIFHAHGLWDK